MAANPLGHHKYEPLQESWPPFMRGTAGRSTSRRPAPRETRWRRLAALCRGGGAGGARRVAGRGDLPLPNSRLSGLGNVSACRNAACSPSGRGGATGAVPIRLPRNSATSRPNSPNDIGSAKPRPSRGSRYDVHRGRRHHRPRPCRAPAIPGARRSVHPAPCPAPSLVVWRPALPDGGRGELRHRRPIRHAPAGRRHGGTRRRYRRVWWPLALFVALIGLESVFGGSGVCSRPTA